MEPQPKLTPTTVDQLRSGDPFVAAVPISVMAAPDPLRPRKVAIIGTAPSSRMLAPFADPEWTIWGTSPGNQGVLPRVDAWVEMHCNLLWDVYKAYGEPYLRWLNDQSFPVLAQDNRIVKRAQTYPLARIIDRFGVRMPQDPVWMPKRMFWATSTFAWAMAYAIDIGVQSMALYGVDMSSKDEYILQRSGGHRFIEFALAAGIELIIPEESDLLQPPPLYGYTDGSAYGRKQAARQTELDGRIAQLEPEVQQKMQQLAYLKGAKECIEYDRAVFGGVGGWGWAAAEVMGDSFNGHGHGHGHGQGEVAKVEALAAMPVSMTGWNPPPTSWPVVASSGLFAQAMLGHKEDGDGGAVR